MGEALLFLMSSVLIRCPFVEIRKLKILNRQLYIQNTRRIEIVERPALLRKREALNVVSASAPAVDRRMGVKTTLVLEVDESGEAENIYMVSEKIRSVCQSLQNSR